MSIEEPVSGESSELSERIDDLSKDLEAMGLMMRQLKDDIRKEWKKTKAGQGDDKKLTKMLKGDLETLVKLSIEQESRLEKHIQSRGGVVGYGAIDFDAVRAELMDRLTKLHASYNAGGAAERG